MKRVIINGDDYGYTPEKNEGILKAHRDGILTSTTVMVNMVSRQAVKNLLKHKRSIGIGLHLNITKGKPISLLNKVPTLFNEKKEMFRPQIWTRKAWNDFGNLKNIAEVELEFNNQLKKFKEKFNIKPSHLDSHHFMTSHKKIFPILLKIAKENKLPIRLPAWIINENKYELETSLGRKAKKQCKTTDHAELEFFCVKKDPIQEFKKAIKNLRGGTTEFMFHPSLLNSDNNNSLYGKIDLDLLTNEEIKRTIEEEGIELISYDEL